MMKLIDKFKTKQFGVLLIIVGAFIPSILYPFTSITTSATLAKVAFAMKGVSYDTSLQDLEIVLVKGEWKKDSKNGGGHYEGRLALPYRYTMAFGILLFFIGIGFVAFYKNKRESD
jgi:hypothetical protein